MLRGYTENCQPWCCTLNQSVRVPASLRLLKCGRPNDKHTSLIWAEMNSINHPRLGIKLYYWAYRNICVRVISYFPVSMGGCITSNFLTATWWTFELRSLHSPNAWSCQIEGQKLTSLYTVFGFQVAKIQLRLGPLESANKPSWCQLQSFDLLGLHSRLNNLQLSKIEVTNYDLFVASMLCGRDGSPQNLTSNAPLICQLGMVPTCYCFRGLLHR